MGKLTHTVKGPIASFRSADKAPIESLKIHFLPKQEGSGDPSPVNIRPISGWTDSDFDQHGINLWDEDWEIGRINVNTGKNDNNVTSTIRSKNYIPCRPGTKYFIKHSMGTNNLCLFFYDKHKNFISYGWKYSLEVTVPDNCYYLRFYLHSTYGTEYHNDVGINYPSSKMSYVPYSGNARISITFPASGKNQFNPNAEWIIGSTYRYIPFYFGEYDYYMSFTVKDPNVDTSDLYIGFSYFEPISSSDATMGYNWCIEKGVIKQNHTNRISQGATNIYYGLIGKYLLVYPNTEDTYSRLLSAYDIQIEKGTSPTAYEPYASDNIVYGGYIDPVRGKLVATWEAINKPLSQWTHSVPTSIRYYTDFAHDMKCVDDGVYGNSQKCNIAPFSWSDTDNTNPHFFIGRSSSKGRAYLYLPADYDGSQVIQVAAKLVTPIEYDIDPITLQAFLDRNNFWSDTNDDTEVEYTFTDHLSKRKLTMNIPHVESASGPVASFNTDMKAPIVDLKAYFIPVQGGTGNPSPSNIRPINGYTGLNINQTGKNLINLSTASKQNNSSNIETTIVDNTITVTAKKANGSGVLLQQTIYWDIPPALRGKEVYFGVGSVNLTTSNENHKATIVCEFKDEDNKFITDPTVVAWTNGGSSNTIVRKTTIPENAVILEIYFRIAQNASTYGIVVGDTVTYNNFYIRYPTEPYGNYEKYNGETIPIKFPATKNLLNPIVTNIIPFKNTGYANYTINNGTIVTSGNALIGFKVKVKPSTTYMFSFKTSSSVTMEVAAFETEPTVIQNSDTFIVGNNVSSQYFTTPSNCEWITCGFYTNGSGVTISELMLELGNKKTAYEPYGNVYSGYVDLIRGKIVSTHKQFILTGYENIEYSAYSGSVYTAFSEKSILSDSKYGDSIYGWCNMISCGNTTTNQIQRAYLRKSYDGYGLQFYYVTSYWGLTEATVEAFVAKLKALSDAGTPFQLVYELATPIEYDLTPGTLKSLIGQNNIWTDTNGNVDVKYWRQDPTNLPKRRFVTWNNLVEGYLSAENWGDRNSADTNTAFENGISETTFLGTNRTYYTMRSKNQPTVYTNHKYFAYAEYQFDSSFSSIPQAGFEYAGGRYAVITPISIGNGWYYSRYLVSGARNGGGYMYIPYLVKNSETAVGQKVKTKNVLYIDLTVMFGEGNEPATSAEFMELCEFNGINFHEPHPKDITGTQKWWTFP